MIIEADICTFWSRYRASNFRCLQFLLESQGRPGDLELYRQEMGAPACSEIWEGVWNELEDSWLSLIFSVMVLELS